MGTCAFNPKRHENPQTSEKLPPFTYLSRDKQLLIICNRGKSQAFSFADSIQLFPDTTIAHINPTFIITLGGTEPSGAISKKVFAINTTNFTLQVLPDLPNCMSKASVFYINHKLLVLNSDYPQLLFHTLYSNVWEEMPLNLSHSRYKRLKNYSAFIQGTYIYMICSEYKSKLTSEIFRISLSSYRLEKTEQSFSAFIANPVCYATDHSVILGAGTKVDGSPNTDFYYKRLGQPWEEIKGPRIGQYENYPFVISKNFPIFFSNSQVVVKFPHRFWVLNLNLPETLKLNSTTKESNKESIGSEISVKGKKKESQSDEDFEPVLDCSLESKPRNVYSLEKGEENEDDYLAGEAEVNESVESKPRAVQIAGKRIEDIKAIKVKAIAPFLPSNVKRESYLNSESSLVDSSYYSD